MISPPSPIIWPAILGFFIGAIPTGYWIGRIYRGIDVRKYGSGNLGATNVFRVLGWKAGAVTLVIDILKGYVAVAVASSLFLPTFQNSSLVETSFFDFLHFNAEPDYFQFPSLLFSPTWIAGVSAILGHSFSPFVKFRGGKGVATAAGVFLALLPIETTIAVATFILIFAFSRIVSLSSIMAVLALSISTVFLSHNPIAVFVSIFIIWRHRENIARLLKGTEKPLGSHEQTN